jgi:hypothetical protein
MSTIRTAFIGPVQTVEEPLNYTKFSYFWLYDVAEARLEKGAKLSL